MKHCNKEVVVIWVELSKRVNKGSRKTPKYKMRSREILINKNLYAFLLKYIDKKTKYILKKKRGETNQPNTIQRIDELYKYNNIPWSPHKSRHYFRTEVKGWIREQRSMDEELINEYMSHTNKSIA